MPDYLRQLRRRLMELGYPPAFLDRTLREIADHREDLMAIAAQDGAGNPEVSAEAALGDPRALAENLAQTRRQSTWCGRHFLAVFGFLPLAFPLFWGVCLAIQVWLGYGLEFGWNVQKLRVAYGDSRFLHRGNIEVAVATHLGTTVITLLFCWLARRSGVKRTWLVIACLVCAYYAFFLTAGVTRGNFFVILNVYHPQWAQAAIPLAAAAFFCLQRQWQAHRCTNAPA